MTQTTLADIAQLTMDLYLQEYRKSSDFFTLVHFKYLVANAYAALLQSEYEKSYRTNLLEKGHGYASISADWLVEAKIKVSEKKGIAHIARFDKPVFSFLYDESNIGIYNISNEGDGEFHLIRIKQEEEYKFRHMPLSPGALYWFPIMSEIRFLGDVHNNATFRLQYIPSFDTLEDELPVPIVLSEQAMKGALNILYAAKNGTPIVDKTPDGNPNKVLATEINSAAAKLE